jgi:hypothetical protein
MFSTAPTVRRSVSAEAGRTSEPMAQPPLRKFASDAALAAKDVRAHLEDPILGATALLTRR